MAGKVEDKTVFKYKAVYPQAPMDMRYHYYDRGILKVNAGLFKLVTTIEELEEFAKECEGQIIGVDTETTGLTYKQDQIVGFSISYTPFSGIYVPIRHALRRTDKVKTNLLDNKGMPLLTKTGKVRTHTVNKHTDFENPANLNPKAALDILDRIMRNAKLCVLHNSEFDLNMIAQEGYDFRKYKTLDTMVLTYLFDAENKSWGKLKEASKIILGRYPTKFEEALGSEENFRYVDLEVAYPYAASDSANTLGIFMNLYPKVKELLNKAPNVLDLGEGRYNVMNRDNELIRAFTDYYGHALIKVNRKTAQEYKDRVEKYLAEVEDKIYSYFKKGQFNLSTSSKEFKQTMEDFNIDTGARTEKGAVSYGKAGIENMTRTLRALKDILQLDWNTKIDYQNGRLNKRTSLDELKLAEMITVYGKEHFDFKDSANFLTIRSIEGIKLEKHEFFQELALMYKSATTKMDILKAIQTRSSLMKALNSYITKLTEVDECRMRYRLTGTSSGRLSSGNGSKSDKKKNHYYIDLNAQNLTKPHSAYYKAIKSDEEGNILGWKFELVDEDYYKAHKEEEIIVEGSSPSNNIRACFEAPEGRLIASLDYSAQEYRVLAILSQDHRMVDNFKKGIDPHTATAYAIWGEENYDRQKRKKAKGCNFLMNYCGGPKTLAENLDIPFEEAKEIIELYEKAYFECIQWKRRTMDDAIKRYDGVAYTRFGRPRQFKTLLSTASMWQDFKFQKENAHIMSAQDLTRKGIGVEEAVKRKIVSHAIQSTCGDICRWDLIQLYRRYFKNRDPHIDFMTTVHDEINYTIDKDYVIDYVREIDDIMTFTALSKELPIITSIDLGYSLGILFPFEWEDETRTNLVPLRA